jgi:hypothetical protein
LNNFMFNSLSSTIKTVPAIEDPLYELEPAQHCALGIVSSLIL